MVDTQDVIEMAATPRKRVPAISRKRSLSDDVISVNKMRKGDEMEIEVSKNIEVSKENQHAIFYLLL